MIRQGVRKVESELATERSTRKSVQTEMESLQQEIAATRSQLDAVHSAHSSALNQLTKLRDDLEKEKSKSRSLAQDVRNAINNSLSEEKVKISHAHSTYSHNPHNACA